MTMRAYMSEPGRQAEARLPGIGALGLDVCSCWPYCSSENALTELARILAETEPAPKRHADGAYWPIQYFGGCGPAMPRNAEAILRDALATWTADGGPLDQLALDAYLGALGALESQEGTPEASADWTPATDACAGAWEHNALATGAAL